MRKRERGWKKNWRRRKEKPKKNESLKNSMIFSSNVCNVFDFNAFVFPIAIVDYLVFCIIPIQTSSIDYSASIILYLIILYLIIIIACYVYGFFVIYDDFISLSFWCLLFCSLLYIINFYLDLLNHFNKFNKCI